MSKGIKGYLLDQYARACGFAPTGSWVLVVLPDGTCEFTPLEPGEARWCCENRKAIAARVAPPTMGLPPWAEGFAGSKPASGRPYPAILSVASSDEES